MKKILIVDDDPSIGNLLQEALTGAGYCTMRAYSGTEALWVVTNTKPDLILLRPAISRIKSHCVSGKPTTPSALTAVLDLRTDGSCAFAWMICESSIQSRDRVNYRFNDIRLKELYNHNR